MKDRIQKVTPVPSEISKERYREICQSGEIHSVPFKWLRVEAFHEGALIREAAAQYFSPDISNPHDSDDKDTLMLWEMMSNVLPEGLLECYSWREDADKYNFPVRVKILIDYPLTQLWEVEVEIPANRFGEIFSICHDMYRHIYDLDDAEWQSKGHQDAAPRAPGLMNRAGGEHVWGHDMSDLVFEWMYFTPNPDWPIEERKRMQFVQLQNLDELKEVIEAAKEGEASEALEEKLAEQAELQQMESEALEAQGYDKDMEAAPAEVSQPKVVKTPAPLTVEEHAGKSPFLGWVTFFIGS